MKDFRWCIQPFWHKARMWRTDGIGVAYTCYSIYAVTRNKNQKVGWLNKNQKTDSHTKSKCMICNTTTMMLFNYNETHTYLPRFHYLLSPTLLPLRTGSSIKRESTHQSKPPPRLMKKARQKVFEHTRYTDGVCVNRDSARLEFTSEKV